ncbi:hypothetical protein [Neokomagataea anthophila]|uniref:Uncharacterized protein n=1 Tax=Neokomagataea anthophila TaxID=2826925 RepID=A0ABS5E4I6_9PROT|nr:hypothetical protein [Neokomagataea anthophila]MBR0558814.1 hypothetical protein [Neokomagataea anthophila]
MEDMIKVIVKIIGFYCILNIFCGLVDARSVGDAHKCVFISPRDAAIVFNKKYNRFIYSDDKDISLSDYGNIISDLDEGSFYNLDHCIGYFFHTNEFNYLDIISQNTIYHDYLKYGASPPRGSIFYGNNYYTIASCDLNACAENIENVIFDRHGMLIAVMESVPFGESKKIEKYKGKYIILERWVLVRKKDLNDELKYFIALSMENLYANTRIRIQKWHYVVSDH